MAIGKTFGGRYVITAPEFGGIGDGVTDNTDAWNRVMNAAAATGGEVFVPQGVFRIDGATVPVPGGVTLRGTGMSYSAPEDGPQQRASVIRAGTTMARLIELGADPHVSTAGLAGAQMRDIIADGRDLANVVVIPNGRRWLIDHCQVYWGALIGVEVLGQNGDLTGNSVVAQNNTGSCVVLRHEPDNKVTGNQLRQAGPEGACLLVQPLGSSQLGTGNIVIQNNHMWLGQNGVPTAGHLIKVDLNASKTEGGMQIVGNQLEGCLGDQIFFNVADSSRCYSTLISSNRFFQNPSLTDNTFSVLGMSGTGTVSDLNMSSNQFSAYSTSRRWRSLIHDYGTGPRDRIMVDANQVRRAVQPWTTAAASTWVGPEPGLNVGLGADGAEWRTRHYGTTTVTGDGTTRVFTLATGLSFPTARVLNVTPRSAAAGASHYASMAGGTLTVEFATAPAAAQPITFTYDLWR